ncbi:MAG: hypothetical protein O3A74_02895 [archaeon]|nr:hypothetical protein [archaeon]MDA0842479.1 hypothetical protein [archaeon]
MEGKLLANIGFSPFKVLPWKNNIIALGVDGEVTILDPQGQHIQEIVTPFPCKITHACILRNQLIATWLDYDILIGRMAAIDLSNSFQMGPTKSEVRKSMAQASRELHPQGSLWSHSLNADVLGMTTIDDSIVFALWKRGLYKLSATAQEDWRTPLPTWPSLQKIPQGEQIISIHDNESSILISSKGGGIAKFSKMDGTMISSEILMESCSLSRHFYSNRQHLCITSNYKAIWMNEGKTLKEYQLNGPVQDAYWDSTTLSWSIAGWREFIHLSADEVVRRKFDDICNSIWQNMHQRYVILNNGRIYSVD